MAIDRQLMERGLAAILQPQQVFEVRILNVQRYSGGGRRNIASGIFDQPSEAIQAMEDFDRRFPVYSGAYLTFNPLRPETLARSPNRLDFLEKTASHEDVLERRWMLIDIDPERLSGISSSETELKHAVGAAGVVYRLMREHFGEVSPLSLRSGNGVHLLYRVQAGLHEDDLLISAALKRIAKDVKAAGETSVSIGAECHDCCRHTKLPGTKAQKGHELPQQTRIFRFAEVKHTPSSDQVPISRDRLADFSKPVLDAEEEHRKKLANFQPKLVGEREKIDVREWLQRHGLKVSHVKPWMDGQMHLLEVCPWKGRDRDKAFVIQRSNGRIHAGCRHGSCSSKAGWHDLRDMFEPGWRDLNKGQGWLSQEIVNERRRIEFREIFHEELRHLREALRREVSEEVRQLRMGGFQDDES